MSAGSFICTSRPLQGGISRRSEPDDARDGQTEERDEEHPEKDPEVATLPGGENRGADKKADHETEERPDDRLAGGAEVEVVGRCQGGADVSADDCTDHGDCCSGKNGDCKRSDGAHGPVLTPEKTRVKG
jgi:hypothetical protein